MTYPIQKDLLSLDDKKPLENVGFFNFSLFGEASDPVRNGPPLWNSGISDELHFFRQNEITL